MMIFMFHLAFLYLQLQGFGTSAKPKNSGLCNQTLSPAGGGGGGGGGGGVGSGHETNCNTYMYFGKIVVKPAAHYSAHAPIHVSLQERNMHLQARCA